MWKIEREKMERGRKKDRKREKEKERVLVCA